MADGKILIVEDEEPIRELIKLALESAGFSSVYTAADGIEGLKLAQKRQPDLILLDLMLPELDGLTLCRLLKNDESTRAIPVIMLTAKSEESDVVLGLELGAVDYITKPFNRKILIARVRAQLRSRSERDSANEIRHAGLVIDKDAHAARLDGAELSLTVSEFDILLLLASHAGRVYTRNQIIARLRGEDYAVTGRAIDVQVLNLRKKLGDWGRRIETVRGIGYRLQRDEL